MNKGTLTILDDKHAVLGYPNNPDRIIYSPAECRIHLEGVKQWMTNGGVLSLPFPVEVTDLRAMREVTVESASILDNITPVEAGKLLENIGNALSAKGY